ncbi:alpha/beta fold hydrolase [Pseudonocardia yunnanensis]|uniref:Alpha/beta fold hydrolase n=1 Tax=Pseudonocardia yunnanensis TaxID=58107 RepID=A0ABW4ET34_9PSEU
MTEQILTSNGVQLCVETFGDPGDPALLLISGMSASMDWWDVEFCERLANEGRFVIRYDHRDTGRSETSPVGAPSYTAADLSTDPLRILDALRIARAHVAGISMGGGITQDLAALHPDRILTVTLISTSPAGARADRNALPSAEPRIAATFANPGPDPAWDDRDAVVEHLVENERCCAGSLGFDEERARRLAKIVAGRSHDVEASLKNHWAVVVDAESNEYRLADIHVPTLVLHGTADPLFPIGHGEALAAEIPGASLLALEGMGHEVPPPRLWDVVVPAIVRHTS